MELLLVSLWKAGEKIFPRGVGAQEKYNGWLRDSDIPLILLGGNILMSSVVVLRTCTDHFFMNELCTLYMQRVLHVNMHVM